LQHDRASGQAGEQRAVGAAAPRDFERADLRLGHGPDRTAERLRQQLMAEADAEKCHAVLAHRLANRRLLVVQPGIRSLLPDVHRPTHDD
jgi:hypothetical protein